MGGGERRAAAGAGVPLTREDREDLRAVRGCLIGTVAGCALWLLLAVILAAVVLSPLWCATPAR